MVFLILSRCGYDNWKMLAALMKAPIIWLADGILSHDECQQLRHSGFNLTVFSKTTKLTHAEDLAAAIATIEEHHPEEVIWVESCAVSCNQPNR
jgi:hypothetical protein